METLPVHTCELDEDVHPVLTDLCRQLSLRQPGHVPPGAPSCLNSRLKPGSLGVGLGSAVVGDGPHMSP